MKLLKYAMGVALAVALTACGGGGGSPGTLTTNLLGDAEAGPQASKVAAPTLTLTVVDDSGVEVINHVLSQTLAQYLKVTLKSSAGVAVPYTRVTVVLDSTIAVLVPSNGAELTNTAGVVLMRIAPANVSSSGPVLATAAATVDGISLSQRYELQITPGTVGLANLTVSPLSVQKGQSINVNVDVTVNGVKAPSNSVAVNFTSACGTTVPSSALVDATGRATAVIQTTSSGQCTVSASSSGVSASPQPVFTVTLPPVTGLLFVSATPNLIYQTGSIGANASVVTFKVIDSIGAPVTTGVTVNASLTNTDGGINFCNSPSSSTSNPEGLVSFSVCGGTLPATVQVRAALAAPNQAVVTSSNLLTVQTGLPTQRFFDISASQFNFYAGGHFTTKYNGNSTDISVFSADRQGNPVPDGTKIIFVGEGGQINSAGQSSCLVAAGRCSIKLIGQEYRPMGSTAVGGDPRPGRVTVLAYADGEEYFIDANNNNRYDTNELFEDIGSPYMDKDESGTFNAAYTNLVTGTNEGEVSYPMPLHPTDGTDSMGTSVCPANSNAGLSVAGTCNGKWDGYTKVRRSIVIVFSGGEIGQPGSYDASIPSKYHTRVVDASRSAIQVLLSDLDGNPLPADASLGIAVIPASSTCKATLFGSVIGSTTEPTMHSASLDSCAGGEIIRFKATVSAGGAPKESYFDVRVP